MKAKTISKVLNCNFEFRIDETKRNSSKGKNCQALKSKKTKIIHKYLFTINFFFGFILFLLLEEIFSDEHYISLKVGETGYQQILSNDYNRKLPVIYINGVVQVMRGKKVNVENTNDEIKLQWDETLTDFTYMFSNLESIISVNMYYIFGNGCDMSYMFYNCKNLENFNYRIYNNISYVIRDMKSMFYNCISLKSFSFSNFYMSFSSCCYRYYNRDMSYMFYNCQSLRQLEYTNIYYIRDMRGMFYNCSSLISLNLNYFHTNNYYVNLSYLLYNCYSLETFQFTNSFLTISMESMFYNCQLLTNINLNNIVTNNPINVSRLFYNCSSLSSIKGNFNNFKIFDTREMFYNCTSLKYFYDNNNDRNNYIRIFIYNNNRDINVNMSYMFYNCRNLENVYIYGRYDSNNKYIYPSDFRSMFYNCILLTYVYLEYFYFDYIQDMSYMFYNCKKLQTFNRFNFLMNSIKVAKRSMKGMFQNCESLEALNLENNFNSANVENMWDMFKGCTKLKNLYINNAQYFDTSKVTDMESMFEGCSSLITLNINSFKADKVQYMNRMFYNCIKLSSLYFSSISATSLGTMHQMFYNCRSLVYLNLFSLSENDQSISEIFQGASTSFQLCIEDKQKIPNIFKEFFEMNLTTRDCGTNCYVTNRVSIPSKKLCCPSKQFNLNCYDKCPSRTRDNNNDNNCENFTCPYYYNYDQDDCITEIPPEHFVNDTKLKTIDKCHPDCETCNEKETDSNHTNCLTCKPPKHIYLGNCYADCLKGLYTNENGDEVCKCFDERCLSCSEEGIKQGLCERCNDDINNRHYPIFENKNGPFRCYKDLEKYYLSDNFFHPCYSSCQTCNKSGTEEVHNCNTCNENTSFPVLTRGRYNCYPNCTYYFYFNEKKEYTCTEGPNCPENYDLIIPDLGQCVISCLNTEYYQYEFKNRCFKECPADSNILDPDKKTCKLTCPFERPFMLQSIGLCVSNCTINDRRDKECVTNYVGNQSHLIPDIILTDIEDHFTSSKYNFSALIEGSVIIQEDNTIYELTTTKNKDHSSITSTLDLATCEDALREFYPIKPEDPLYILKYDTYVPGKEGPTVRYRVYYPLDDQNVLVDLQLTICENLPIFISLPANITGDPAIYDKNSAYYNDLCAHYDFNDGVDMTLEDRQKQYVENNQSFCEEDCTFKGYDKETLKVDCSCEVKFNLPLVSEIKVDKDKLYKFMDIKKIANFDVLRCWKLITSKEGIITNIGFYLFIPVLITYFLTIFIFYLKENKLLKAIIKDIIYARKYMKYLSQKRPPRPKKIMPPMKYKKPILLEMIDLKKEAEEAQKYIDPAVKKKKANMINKIMKNDGLMKLIQNTKKEDLINIINKKKDLIEENNINNEKSDTKKEEKNNKKEKKNIKNEKQDKKEKKEKTEVKNEKEQKAEVKNEVINENNNNKELIEDKKETPKENEKKLNAPPIKEKNNVKNTTKKPPNTELITNNDDLPSSKKNINVNKKAFRFKSFNFHNDSKESGILSSAQEEKIRKTMRQNDSELNVLDFKDALKYDKRNYLQYYISLLKTKHMFVKVINNTDYNSRMIKIFLILFNFAMCFAVNALFFNDDTMHKILEDGGDFNIIYQLPQIAYSSIISFIFENILNFLALSEEDILSVKHEKVEKKVQRKAEEVIRALQMKFLGFFVISFCFVMLFWYYITCFCAVYFNTQYHLIKDTLISFGTAQITPFALNLIPGLFRIPALKTRKEFLYVLSKVIQLF